MHKEKISADCMKYLSNKKDTEYECILNYKLKRKTAEHRIDTAQSLDGGFIIYSHLTFD
jgi:hypothetical protein